EGGAARHARAEVVADLAEHDDGAAGHVLARVVARALDDGGGARVPHAEALAAAAADEQGAAGRAIEAGVADEHGNILERRAGRGAGVVVARPDHDASAGHALADVIVGLADEIELDAVGEEGAEALPGRAGVADNGGAARRQLASLEGDGAAEG